MKGLIYCLFISAFVFTQLSERQACSETSKINNMQLESSSIMLAHFDQSESIDNWRIVNDGVMGGLSQSRMQWDEQGHGIFSGEVSLDNNGGFASVRYMMPDINTSAVDQLKIRVKGDGQRYSFRVRSNERFDGASYEVKFDTKNGEWTEHAFNLSEFKAVFRGRTLTDYPPLEGANIEQLGFLISDKQVGKFKLLIDQIEGIVAL